MSEGQFSKKVNRKKAYRRNHKGVITIEAAIILPPLVIMTVLGIIYFMKIMFIQEQIHGAMTRTAHEMASYGVMMEKTELIGTQQKLILEGPEAGAVIQGSIEEISNTGTALTTNARDLTDLSMGSVDLVKDWDLFGGEKTFNEFALEAYETIKEIPVMIDEIQTGVNQFVEAIHGLFTGALSNITGLVSAELLEYINGMIVSKVTEHQFYDYISKINWRHGGACTQRWMGSLLISQIHPLC